MERRSFRITAQKNWSFPLKMSLLRIWSHSPVIRPKLRGNCPFPQNVHTRKLSEISVFCAVITGNVQILCLKNKSQINTLIPKMDPYCTLEIIPSNSKYGEFIFSLFSISKVRR